MRSEWQVQQEIKSGRNNDAAERCKVVRDRVNAENERAARVEATVITVGVALVLSAVAYFFI